MIRKILHKPQALLGLAMMLIVFFVVAFAPFIAPHDPSELNVAHALSAPDSEYPLGTDEMGAAYFHDCSMARGHLCLSLCPRLSFWHLSVRS